MNYWLKFKKQTVIAILTNILFIAVGFSQRIKGREIKALAKLFRAKARFARLSIRPLKRTAMK
jgi:Tfp pilus assembly protein FimT